jgi:hypothetical protein
MTVGENTPRSEPLTILIASKDAASIPSVFASTANVVGNCTFISL